jgi:ribosomal protein S17
MKEKKVFSGVVISIFPCGTTAKVEVVDMIYNRSYNRVVKYKKKYLCHVCDLKDLTVGAKVQFCTSSPISAKKRFKILNTI